MARTKPKDDTGVKVRRLLLVRCAAGAPKIHDATKAQINAAKEIRDQLTLGLTA